MSNIQIETKRKRIVILSASPKVDQSTAVSAFLASRGESLLIDEQTCNHRHLPALFLLHACDADSILAGL